MSKYKEIETIKQRITDQRNFLVAEQEQLRKADYSDTLQNAKYKDEKLFRFSKRISRLKYLFDQLTEELK